MGIVSSVIGLIWLGLVAPEALLPRNAPLKAAPSHISTVQLVELQGSAPAGSDVSIKARDGLVRVVSGAAAQTAVTIYPDNLALITEVRKVNVPAGKSVIAFEGVSDLIIPQSMVLREFTGFTLERNFDYDLLSKTTLFENAVGEMVTLTRFDKSSGAVVNQSAEIVSARRDTGVVMRVEGKVETLSCSGLTERVSFGSAEAGLTAKPVMSVQVNADIAGEQDVVISYLTSGLGWKADYRIDLKEAVEGKPVGTRNASLLAWLTLSNRTAKDYADVTLAIIAGDLNRDSDTRAVSPPKPYLQGQCYPIGSTKRGIAERINQVVTQEAFLSEKEMLQMAPMAASYSMSDEIVVTGARSRKMATEENVGDYKLYRVPGLVSIKPYQTKQIAFLDEPRINVIRYFKAVVYGFQNMINPQPLQLTYELNNDRDDGLARSLPKGTFRIFDTRANGRAVYLGETSKGNLAVDEDVELTLSRAMSVQMQTTKGDERRDDVAVHSFFNAMDETVRVKVENMDESLRGKRLYEPGVKRDAEEIIPTWWLDIPSESVTELTYGKR